MKVDKELPKSYRNPVKTFEGHEKYITFLAIFTDGKRIVTGSDDNTIRIWRLEDGMELKKWEVKKEVTALVILRNGKHVVSAEEELGFDARELLVRDAESGMVVAGPFKDCHTDVVDDLDVSPDGNILASGSWDRTVILWDTNTWQRKGHPLSCGSQIYRVRFSPSSGQLGVATHKDIQIWDLPDKNSEVPERLAQFNGHAGFSLVGCNSSLIWIPDRAYLLSAGNNDLCSWDTSTWEQVSGPWTGHVNPTLNPAGTLLASVSSDRSDTVHLWNVPAVIEVARYQHSHWVDQVAFSVDGRSIFSGGLDKKISQWEIPEDVLTVAENDLPASTKNEAAWGKHNMKHLLNSEISGQRRNKPATYQRFDTSRGWDTPSPLARAERPSSSHLLDLRTFFDGVRPSSDKKGKQKERRPKRDAPQVVDVPLGQATYGDVVGVDDGTRPYVLFFCLSWFQKKKKKPDPPRPVYDDELYDDESEHAVLDVPIPTARTQTHAHKEIKLTPMTFFQSQPEAGPSRLAAPEEYPEAQSS